MISDDRDIFRDLVEYMVMNKPTLLSELKAWFGEEPKNSRAVE